VWAYSTPIVGPISADFRRHHEDPTLDPSAKLTNLTKGAYAGIVFALFSVRMSAAFQGSVLSAFTDLTCFLASLWMLGFHQIHSYAHMGSTLSAEQFNQAVARTSALPLPSEQRREFAKLFDSVSIPPSIRFLQRQRLFLRPEIHWQHHQAFETDFSSVNGWSDPMMNWIYRRIAVCVKARRSRTEAALSSKEPQCPVATH
jgi:hypothetical protein